MRFEEGNEFGNRRGRPKGSPNKVNEQIKKSFALLLENKLPEIEEWLTKAAEDDPARAIDMLIKISERFVPKLSQQALTGADGDDLFKNLQFKFNTLKSTNEDG